MASKDADCPFLLHQRHSVESFKLSRWRMLLLRSHLARKTFTGRSSESGVAPRRGRPQSETIRDKAWRFEKPGCATIGAVTQRVARVRRWRDLRSRDCNHMSSTNPATERHRFATVSWQILGPTDMATPFGELGFRPEDPGFAGGCAWLAYGSVRSTLPACTSMLPSAGALKQ